MGLSVITICRNPGDAILPTAASIAGQGPGIRWIVVDGASEDGTPDRLRGLGRAPDVLHSGRDGGIADAFNIGLDLAQDDDVHVLNAGDRFAGPGALAAIAAAWRRESYRWAVGGIVVEDARGRILGERRPPAGVAPRRLVSRGNRIPHPAVLAPAPFLRGLGGFDASYRYSMDYELWLRAIAAGHPPQVVDAVVAVFALGGRSGDVAGRLAEDRRARRRHGLSDGWLAEAWLACGGLARRAAAPLRGSALAYRCNRMAGW